MSLGRMDQVKQALGPGTGLVVSLEVSDDDERDPWDVFEQDVAEMSDAEFHELLVRIHSGNQQAAELS